MFPHFVDLEREHVRVRQLLEVRGGVVGAELSREREPPVGRDGRRRAALDRGGSLLEQVADERGLRRAPRGRTGRARVADRQQVEQSQSFGVGRARRREVVGDRRVREVAAGRDVGHQQVVADEPRDDLAAFTVEADTACERGRGIRACL